MRRIIFSSMLALVLMPGLTSAIVVEADLEILSFEVLSAPETVQVGELFDIVLQKVVTNNGPGGPADAVLTYNATAPLGSSISPTAGTEPVEDLAVSENRTVLEFFQASISEAGIYTFTFANELELVDEYMIDPDPGNNYASLEVTISTVPVPPAVWLFGTGLLGLVGLAKHKKTA